MDRSAIYIVSVIEKLLSYHNIKYLDLSENILSNQAAKALRKLLKRTTAL